MIKSSSYSEFDISLITCTSAVGTFKISLTISENKILGIGSKQIDLSCSS